MKRSLAITLGCLVLVGVGVAIKLAGDRPASAPNVPAAPARPDAGAAPVKQAPAGQAPAAKPEPTVKLEKDAAAVFQRAFWRRPGPGDKVLHGERRDWMDASAAVQKWQWFVAVTPSPEFRRWLIEDNPFELTSVKTPAEAPLPPEGAPAWFPAKAELDGFTQYRVRGGRFTVYLDTKANRIFATDSGAGFAAATR